MKRTAHCLVLACGLFLGCLGAGPQKPEAAREQEERVVESRREGERRDKEIRRMGAAELVKRLRADSGNRLEPFNSRAFQEAVRRGDVLADPLTRSIRGRGVDNLLALLALRHIASEHYVRVPQARRLQILDSSLRTSTTFNIWGLPEFHWEDAAKAFIGEGEGAVPVLKKHLDDKREAPVWGHEEVMIYRTYRFRVCDYALAMLNEIQGREEKLGTNSATRDQQIQRAKNR